MGTQFAEALKQALAPYRVPRVIRVDRYPGGSDQRVYDRYMQMLDGMSEHHIVGPCLTKGCIWKSDLQPS